MKIQMERIGHQSEKIAEDKIIFCKRNDNKYDFLSPKEKNEKSYTKNTSRSTKQ